MSSVRTVDTHKRNLLDKRGAKTAERFRYTAQNTQNDVSIKDYIYLVNCAFFIAKCPSRHSVN